MILTSPFHLLKGLMSTYHFDVYKLLCCKETIPDTPAALSSSAKVLDEKVGVGERLRSRNETKTKTNCCVVLRVGGRLKHRVIWNEERRLSVGGQTRPDQTKLKGGTFADPYPWAFWCAVWTSSTLQWHRN